MNERLFRHLFQHTDGSTSGLQRCSSTIGKKLENSEKLPLTNLPELSPGYISTDQKYLYKIVEVPSTGTFPSDLAKKPPTKFPARWQTLANRILRLYVSVKTPDQSPTDFKICNRTIFRFLDE